MALRVFAIDPSDHSAMALSRAPAGAPVVYVAIGPACPRCQKMPAGVATAKKMARRMAYRLMSRPHPCVELRLEAFCGELRRVHPDAPASAFPKEGA